MSVPLKFPQKSYDEYYFSLLKTIYTPISDLAFILCSSYGFPLYFHIFVHYVSLSIYLSIYLSIHLPIHPSAHWSIHPWCSVVTPAQHSRYHSWQALEIIQDARYRISCQAHTRHDSTCFAITLASWNDVFLCHVFRYWSVYCVVH